MTPPPHLRTLWLLIQHPAGHSVLTDGSSALPSAATALDPGDTTIAAAGRVLASLGLTGPVIDCFIDQATEGGGPVHALVESTTPDPAWAPPTSWAWQRLTEPMPAAPAALADAVDQRLDEWRGGRAVPDERAPWSRVGWYERVCEWIDQALVDTRRSPASTVTQFRQCGISAVLRVDHAGGSCWFKATIPHFGSEPAITELLHRRFPHSTPPVVAIDPDQGWLLLDHVGERSVAEDPTATAAAIDTLVGLQRAFVGSTDELVAAGCRRRPLAHLPDEIDQVLTSPFARNALALTETRQQQVVAWLRDAVASIEQLGLPDTLVHGDFHPDNAAIQAGRVVLFDWSDAAVSHPLVEIGTWAWWFTDEPQVVDELWRRFADAWSDAVAAEAILNARRELEAVSAAYHTVSYAGILAAVEPRRRIENLDGLTTFFALVDAAVPR